MKISTFLAVICLAFFAVSCNVTESIVFNEDMGGTFKTNFDLSPMMQIAKQSGTETAEKPSKVVDTLIVFDDFFKFFKDSIATLPEEKQLQLEAMKGVVVEMKMDDANNEFTFGLTKSFKTFDELKTINDQMDGAMNMAKTFGDTEAPASDDIMDAVTTSDKINYTFSDNIFRRSQPKKEALEDAMETTDSLPELADMAQQINDQFEDVFKASFYTMTYTFPKPIKSVSNANSVISKDRKTVTYKVDLNAVNKDQTLMDLEIKLED